MPQSVYNPSMFAPVFLHSIPVVFKQHYYNVTVYACINEHSPISVSRPRPRLCFKTVSQIQDLNVQEQDRR